MKLESIPQFDILSSTYSSLTLPKRLFLEASAGTGKTYTIEHYVVRAILESIHMERTPLVPSQTLIVTFTQAASKEMKERVSSTLRHAAFFLEMIRRKIAESTIDDNIEDEVIQTRLDHALHDEPDFLLYRDLRYIYVYIFFKLDKETSQRKTCLIERVWKLRYTVLRFLSEIDQATITTIHGFFDRIVSQFEEECSHNNISNCFWISQDSLKTWMRECLTWSLPQNIVLAKEWMSLVVHYSHDEEKLLEDITRKISYESMWQRDSLSELKAVDSSAVPFSHCRIMKWNSVRSQIKHYVDRFSEDEEQILKGILYDWAARRKGTTNRQGQLSDTIKKAIDYITCYLFKPSFDEKIFSNAVEAYPVIEKIARSDVKKRAYKEKKECPPCKELCASTFFQHVWPYIQNNISPTAIFQRLYEYILHLFKTYVQEKGAKTPQSVIERAFRLVETDSPIADKNFLKYASDRFKIVIIDEFQDTDLYQWSTFCRLFVDNQHWNGHILFVGDPKQAIYGFRKADVYSYLDAKNRFTADEKKTLSTNYRSSTSLVEAMNIFFSYNHVDKWIFFLPRYNSSLTLKSLASKANRYCVSFDQVRPQTCVHFPIIQAKIGRKKSWPTDDVEMQSLFPWLQEEIQQLITKEKISLRDIAILVRDRYQARRVSQYLARNDISSILIRVDSIIESILFPFFVALLDAIEYPHDIKKVSLFLLIARSKTTLHHAQAVIRDVDLFSKWVRSFEIAKESFYKYGFGGLIHTLVSLSIGASSFSFPMWIYHIFGEDPQLLIDLEHLFEIASHVYTLGHTSLASIKDALSHLKTIYADDLDALTRRSDLSSDAVQIMTMHKSKGLEFSVVFAIGATVRTPFLEEKDTVSLEERSAYIMELDAEKLRQLYVACTRAKKRLYLPFAIESSEKAPPRLGTSSPLELFFSAHSNARKDTIANSSSLQDANDWHTAVSKPLHISEVIQIVDHFVDISHKTISYELVSLPYITKAKKEAICDVEKNKHSIEIEQQHESIGPAKKQIQYVRRDYVSFSSLKRQQYIAQEKEKIQNNTLEAILLTSLFKHQTLHNLTQKKETRTASISSRLFGVRFHVAIATWIQDIATAKCVYTDREKTIEYIQTWIKKKFPSWSETQDQLSVMIYTAMTVALPFHSQLIPLYDIPRSCIATEQQFIEKVSNSSRSASSHSTEIKEEFIQGTIDLVIHFERSLYLIDWKTNVVAEDTHLQKYIEDMGYTLQYTWYMKAATTFIQYCNELAQQMYPCEIPQMTWGGFSFVFLQRLQESYCCKEGAMQVGIQFKESENSYTYILSQDTATVSYSLPEKR